MLNICKLMAERRTPTNALDLIERKLLPACLRAIAGWKTEFIREHKRFGTRAQTGTNTLHEHAAQTQIAHKQSKISKWKPMTFDSGQRWTVLDRRRLPAVFSF